MPRNTDEDSKRSRRVIKKSKPKIIVSKKKILDDKDYVENDIENDIENDEIIEKKDFDNDDSDEDKVEKKLTKTEKLNQEIDELKSSISNHKKEITKLNKKLESKYKSLNKAYEATIKKMTPKKRKNTKTGIMKEQEIKGDFADWLGVDEGTMLTRPQIYKKMVEMLKEKDMVADDDGRVYVPDKNTAKLFGISSKGMKSRNYKDKNGFNILNAQTRIKYALENS